MYKLVSSLRPDLIDPDDFTGQSLDFVVRELISEINDIKVVLLNDKQARKDNPALQEAWERYQIIKGLTNGRHN